METSHYLKQLVSYNLWANSRIAVVLVKVDKAELEKEISSSFSSIRKTVYHIWDAEYIWLNRINGISLTAFPSKTFGNEVAIDAFLACSRDFETSVKNAPDSFFLKSCTYKNLQQKEFTNSHTEIIMHCMNHSTYHRGQLVTLLRQAGIAALPSTDFIAFLRN
ncbi:MAG: DinB family protein [Bacteroidetes bacterium]|nr:DinB family protein [Bacteroidota bacterium]